MEMQLDLQVLPEGCIANVISLTSPPDACRLSLLSKVIRSAAESDAVWDKFIPPETHTILSQSQSNSLSSSPAPKSKKDLYMALCDNPVLLDEGNMSFSLDKCTGKMCYMIAARRLRIAWGDDTRYWEWISLPESRFKEAAKLKFVCWLEIRGRIETRMLSPSTTYRAYLVYKLAERQVGLNSGAVATVGARACGFDYESPGLLEVTAGIERTAILVPQREVETLQLARNQQASDLKFPNENRVDGWLEMELGEFHCQGEDQDHDHGELEMIFCETYSGKSGLIVQGIEVRPKQN